MPELSEMVQDLYAEAGRATWAEPAELRARGDRRTRYRLVATTVAAVVAVAVVGAGMVALQRTSHPTTPPAGPTPTSSVPLPQASATSGPAIPPPTPTGSLRSGVIPASALLTPGEVGSGYRMIDRSDGLYSPNPFANCMMDGFPHGADVVAGYFENIGGPDTYTGSRFGETVMAFRPGTAHPALTGIRGLPSGPCRGHFTLVGSGFAGDESLLLHNLDAQPGALPVRRTAYVAIVRVGDHVAWVEVVDRADRAGLAARTRDLGRLAATRMCAGTAC